MTKEAFMKEMDLILDGADITFESNLDDIEDWDSIALVGFMSLAATNGKKITMSNIRDAKTIADLYSLANEEKTC